MSKWNGVQNESRIEVWNKLLELNRKSLEEFMLHMERAVLRQINGIRIFPLHGSARDCFSIHDAIEFVTAYDEAAPTGPLVKYEVIIKYDNGDKIEGQFQDRTTTVEFLRSYQSGNWKPSTEVLPNDVEN